MTWQPEMELVDQLLGDDLPLSTVVSALFRNDDHAVRVLSRYVQNGVLTLTRNGEPLAMWESQQLLRDASGLGNLVDISASLTEKGAQAFEKGIWDSL